MSLERASEFDPRGVIAESYHIEGISEADARAIFLDWAMADVDLNFEVALINLWQKFGEASPSHPMSRVLKQGLEKRQEVKRRGGRKARSAEEINK